MFQLVLLLVFFVLISTVGKNASQVKKNIFYSIAVFCLLVLIGSLFTRDIWILALTSLWIIPIALFSSLKEKHSILYGISISVGLIWFLSVFLFVTYQLFLFFPSLLVSVVLNMFAVLPAYQLLGSIKTRKEAEVEESLVAKTLSRLSSRTSGSFWVSIVFPFVIYFGLINLGLGIQPDALQEFYSVVCQILATLLGITVTLATFLPIRRKEFVKLGDYLRRCVKSLFWLYGVGIGVSLVGLVLVPEIRLIWQIQSASIQVIISQATFSSTMALSITCILFLAIIFFEILEIRSK